MDCPRHVAAGCQQPCLVSWCLLVQDLQGATRLRVLWQFFGITPWGSWLILGFTSSQKRETEKALLLPPTFFRNCPGRGRPSNHARAWRAGPLHHHKPSSSWEDRAWCPSRGSCVLRIPAGNGRCHYTPFCSCISFVCFLGSDFPVKHSLFLRAFFQFYLALPIGITHSKKAQYITNTKRKEPKGEGRSHWSHFSLLRKCYHETIMAPGKWHYIRVWDGSNVNFYPLFVQ